MSCQGKESLLHRRNGTRQTDGPVLDPIKIRDFTDMCGSCVVLAFKSRTHMTNKLLLNNRSGKGFTLIELSD
jgi:hypothetical protein